MNLNLKDLSSVQIIDEKPFLFHRNGFVIDGKTMKRCGWKNKNGYTFFGNQQSLHRWMIRVFTDWAKQPTPKNFPGGYKAWKQLNGEERMNFYWDWGVADHIRGLSNGNGIDNLQFLSGKENSKKGNKTDE